MIYSYAGMVYAFYLLIDQMQVEEQKLDNSTGQIWKIASVDPSDCEWWIFNCNVSGYFNVINPATGKLLTALAAFDLKVLGTYIVIY